MNGDYPNYPREMVEEFEAQIAALTKERDDWKIGAQHRDRCFHSAMDDLAASQAREAKLREAVDWMCANGCNCRIGQDALALPQDDTALRERLAEERERCAQVLADHPGHVPSNKWNAASALGSCEQSIRSMK